MINLIHLQPCFSCNTEEYITEVILLTELWCLSISYFANLLKHLNVNNNNIKLTCLQIFSMHYKIEHKVVFKTCSMLFMVLVCIQAFSWPGFY